LAAIENEWGYQQYSAAAKKAAADNGIPWELFKSQITQESGWNPYALGTSGEYGLGQLKQGAAQDVGANRYDPVSNLQGSAKYLANQFKSTGNWTDALRAYNQGAKGASDNPAAGKQYAEEVITRAQSYGWNGATATTPTGSSSLPVVAEPKDFWDMLYNAQKILDYKLTGRFDAPYSKAVDAVADTYTGAKDLAALLSDPRSLIVIIILGALVWSSVGGMFKGKAA
jgi:hypothetical protein